MSSMFDLDALFDERTSKMLYGWQAAHTTGILACCFDPRLALSIETLNAKEESIVDSNMAVKGASTQQLADVTQSIARLGCEASPREGCGRASASGCAVRWGKGTAG